MAIVVPIMAELAESSQVSRVGNLYNDEPTIEEEIVQTANVASEVALSRPTIIKNSVGDSVEITMDNWRDYWDETKVTAVEDTNGVLVPVPIGYASSKIQKEVDGEWQYCERTVDTGFVIYEGSEEPEGKIQVSNNVIMWSTNEEAEINSPSTKRIQYARNQWVWIPVYDSSAIYGVDSNGRKWGKLYDFATITDNKPAKLNWTENSTTGVMSITSSTGNKEPDVLKTGDRDNGIGQYITEEERNELNKEMKNTYENIIASIEKYGGFYIGRYETGSVSGTARVVKGNSNLSGEWYKLYQKSRYLNGMNNNVSTTMIYGSLWDATLQWLVDSGNKTYNDLKATGTWGNSYNSSFKYINASGGVSTKPKQTYTSVSTLTYDYPTIITKSTIIPSGSSEYTNANNIYDIAGNVIEWNVENGVEGTRVRTWRKLF